MKRVLLSVCVLFGCAAADRATVYTENGLRAGEQAWDGHYRAEAERCERLHEPETPEMEACFGDTYDADAKVATAVTTAVALLRAYWTARAAGEQPDWAAVAKQIAEIIAALPPKARAYLERVKGI